MQASGRSRRGRNWLLATVNVGYSLRPKPHHISASQMRNSKCTRTVRSGPSVAIPDGGRPLFTFTRVTSRGEPPRGYPADARTTDTRRLKLPERRHTTCVSVQRLSSESDLTIRRLRRKKQLSRRRRAYLGLV